MNRVQRRRQEAAQRKNRKRSSMGENQTSKRNSSRPTLRPSVGHHVNLECPTDQTLWSSNVIAIDWSGPVYEEAFCPKCCRKGQRETITEDNIGGLFSNAEIALIGQENIHTFLFIVTQMFKPDDYRLEAQLYPVLTADFIGKHSCEHPEAVRKHVDALEQSRWLLVDSPAAKHLYIPHSWQFTFGSAWQDFFARIEAKKQELAPVTMEERITELLKETVIASDCGHQSPRMIFAGFPAHLVYLRAEPTNDPERSGLKDLQQRLAAGLPLNIDTPLLCPECAQAEVGR